MVEQAEARNAIACTAAHARLAGSKAEVRPLSSGFLVSGTMGAASGVGLGRRGKLSSTEVDVMEEFFSRAVQGGCIPLCPATSAELHRQLHELGYRGCYDMAVMACVPGRGRTILHPKQVVVEPVRVGTQSLWIRTIAEGFGDGDDLGASVIANIPGVSCYLARDASGQPLGGGAMIRHGRVAILFGDSTVPHARGRGVQKELIHRRLLNAKAMGCDLVTSLTVPGSISQHNYERIGFKAAYTRLVLADAA